MDTLFSILLFAGLFYLMMRFGCGAHMRRGHHHGHHANDQTHEHDQQHKDPVCGMEVAADQGYSKMHEGHQYHFCSRDCLDKFEADPARYLSKELSKSLRA